MAPDNDRREGNAPGAAPLTPGTKIPQAPDDKEWKAFAQSAINNELARKAELRARAEQWEKSNCDHDLKTLPERRELARREVEKLGPIERNLRKREWLLAVLRGELRLNRQEREALAPLLTSLANIARYGARGAEQEVNTFQNERRMKVLNWASDPKRLHLLSRYITSTANRVERTMRQLEAAREAKRLRAGAEKARS